MKVNVKINGNCELVAIPMQDCCAQESELNSETNVAFIEFLINPNIDSNKTISVSGLNNYYCYEIPEDGLYIYCKVKVAVRQQSDSDLQLYYDNIQNKIFFKGQELKDILEVMSYLQFKEQGILDFVKVPIFSICKLRNCLKELQKRYITENNVVCNTLTYDRKMLDFIFISIYVIDNLIEQERYGEASEILESLLSCAPICKDLAINKSKCKCNCK